VTHKQKERMEFRKRPGGDGHDDAREHHKAVEPLLQLIRLTLDDTDIPVVSTYIISRGFTIRLTFETPSIRLFRFQ
jgi:hypothetical protein